ncbi:MAG: single-stranded DNA-binding protein [Candidatus Vogelbacteria bacterium CG10_big_fil_rev_8_21_14_0_10_45_14]|uniref:Single-stranded DNA-binding protein n=1 Tax=Candidatus Vogelbacteria bacterium CG10_big_fil_rev_8_21_14_0_10_45_14 TaxID=1975042 RepID=A0A2H0RJL0_9BACT|nr:MAG: single-stranded DNA-binding protein [Candidatus Vogelbacteria bacterium CG10_big_fil_rev_8_21_14_0_10_45_14]
MFLNKVIIAGNLTRDPELKTIPNGNKVTTMGVATNRVWMDKDGRKQEAVEFHTVSVFGRQAETSAQYLKKGQQVLVEGRLQTKSWDGADGKKNYRTEIVADRVQFGQKAGGGGGTASGAGYSKDESKSVKETDSTPSIQYPEEDINPDDIPF